MPVPSARSGGEAVAVSRAAFPERRRETAQACARPTLWLLVELLGCSRLLFNTHPLSWLPGHFVTGAFSLCLPAPLGGEHSPGAWLLVPVALLQPWQQISLLLAEVEGPTAPAPAGDLGKEQLVGCP